MLKIAETCSGPWQGLERQAWWLATIFCRRAEATVGSPRTDKQNKETASTTIAESPAASIKIEKLGNVEIGRLGD